MPQHMSGGTQYDESQIAGPSCGPHAHYMQKYHGQDVEYIDEDSYSLYEMDHGQVYADYLADTFENDF